MHGAGLALSIERPVGVEDERRIRVLVEQSLPLRQ